MGGDPGLFGPDSVTWRVHADPMLAVAGLRSLLLQAVHPLAMAGVAEHSGYRTDPWGRLYRTAEYVGVVTYGTRAEAEQAGARIRGLHRRIRGVEPESGVAYRASDPELLRWVHCSEVESFLTTYRRCGGALSPAEADRYVDEQVRAAVLVGLDPGGVPATTRELDDYFRKMRPELRVTKQARQAALFILRPPMPRWVALGTPARPAWAGLGLLAFALLPRWARRLYRLPGLPTTDLTAAAYGRLLRLAAIALPAGVREGPHVRAAWQRLAEADDDGGRSERAAAAGT